MPSRHEATGLGREGGARGSPESEDLPHRLHFVPLAEGGNVLRRSFAAALFVVALAACGGNSSSSGQSEGGTTAAAEPQAAVLVTTDCGAKVVLAKTDVSPDETAMRSLDRVADVATDSGGKFVTAIEGVEQNTGKKLAWAFYVNGKLADKGAAEVKLAAGDVEWWDLHNWEKECASVPADAQ
jgi:hypothetical protein